MSSSSLTPFQRALKDAYFAACDLLPRDLHRSAILIGGAASIVHGMASRKTDDVDIVVTTQALAILNDAIDNRQGGFHKDSDESIMWSKRDGLDHLFYVRVELIEIEGPFVPRIPSVVSFGKGCVASLPELVRLRCETLVARGGEHDFEDLRLLLPMVRQKGLKLPHIEEEEMGVLVEAVGMLEDEGSEVIFIDILSSFEAGGRRWDDWKHYLSTV